MNRFIIIFLSLLFALPLSGKKTGELHFNENGEFKILQLTDLHIMGNNLQEAEKTFARIVYMAESERPDLIIVTGDAIYGRHPADTVLHRLVNTFDALQIPFAMVFGNHEDEYWKDRAAISRIIYSGKYNINELDKAGELADMRIPVRSHIRRSSSSLDLYLLDSHGYTADRKRFGKFQWLTFDQVCWFRQTCEKATSDNGGVNVPSLAFFHIPLPEFLDAWLTAESAKNNSVIGIRGEFGGHPKINSGMFSAMFETGSTMGVFCGHDHNSDFIVPYYGIALVYGRYSGDHTTYNALPHGARLISVKEGERAFTSWIREDDGKIRQKTCFKDGEITKLN